jgi:AcrR family transcriptional regulator
MNETTIRRERKDAARNLERVLDAARELFAERGGDVTMEEVAQRAGVGVGTIYRRFQNKEHLFATLSQAACRDTRFCLYQAADDAPDTLGKLRAIIVVQYRQVALQSGLIKMQPVPMNECDSCAQHDLYASVSLMLRQLIAEGQRQGHIRPGDPAVLAALCLELLSPHTFERLQLVVGPREDLAEQVASFVIAGLVPFQKEAL